MAGILPDLKIISGGQTGVDQAALHAAQDCGLPCGGWCPPGRVCEAGGIPGHFPLQETPAACSPDAPDIPRSQRTEWNVRDSDATLIFQPRTLKEKDPGTDWTRSCAIRYKKPFLICDPADLEAPAAIQKWLGELDIRMLNIAGPSEETVPGIGLRTHALLVRIFSVTG